MRADDKILLFGPSGQVGAQLLRVAQDHFGIMSVSRSVCDLTDEKAVRETVLRASPSAIVNAAAYTAVDKAEAEESVCEAVNAVAPGAMAQAARELGIPLVHYSTDYVFDGQKEGPYTEEDLTAPLGVYGRTKLEGEHRIAASGAEYVILRTSWVYGAEGQNFLRTMLRLGAERPELRIVGDQVGAPTAAKEIAEATLRILSGEQWRKGLYHMTAGGSTSWFGFAERIFALASAATKPKLVSISTAEYPTPARRPRNSVLSNAKFEAAFGFRLAAWGDTLREVMSAGSEAGSST